MIIAYYSEKKQYIQKNEYKKFIKSDSLLDLLSNIKATDEKVIIKASSKDILDIMFETLPFEYDCEVIGESVPLTDAIIDEDFNEEKTVAYKPHEKYKTLLGDKVYFSDNPQKTYDSTSKMSFSHSDLPLLHDYLVNKNKIPMQCMIKMLFGGKIVL